MKKIIYFVFLTFGYLSANSQVNTVDSLALVDLYNSTFGASWTDNTNWLTTSNVSTWNGITINSGSGRVTEIRLSSNNLTGSLPSSIGDLDNLQFISLSNNSLSSSIPSQITNILSLRRLYLDNNLFTGSIPTDINNWTLMYQLFLNNNNLTGSIPSAIADMHKMRILYLNNNSLSGSLPSIDSLILLTDFGVSDNNLSGSIPDMFEDMSDLNELYLLNNSFTGSIPTSIGSLSSLTQLWIGGNNLDGGIPASLSNLTNLEGLGLQNNDLTGNVDNFSLLNPNLIYLFLNDNFFSSTSGINSGSLTDLDLSTNQFDFSDLLTVSGPTNFAYANQDSIGTNIDTILNSGDDISFTVSDLSIGNNYQWYKDGGVLVTETLSSINLTDVNTSNDGRYTCEITNASLPDLTLNEKSSRIQIQEELTPSTCGNYTLTNKYLKPLGTKFCLPISATTNVSSGIIGMDFCINYDPTLCSPTGLIYRRNVFTGGTQSHTEKYVYINDNTGEANIALYYNNNAPLNKEFAGSGDIVCIEFESNSNNSLLSSNVTFCGVNEGFETSTSSCTVSRPQSSTSFLQESSAIAATNILRGYVYYWGDAGKPLKFESSQPSKYKPTNAYLADINCDTSGISTTVKSYGQFLLSPTTETNLIIERDIEGDFHNSSSCTDVSGWINLTDINKTKYIITKDTTELIPTVHQIIAADVNMDGVVRSNDLTLIYRRFNSSICEFPQNWNYSSGTPSVGDISYDWLFIDNNSVLNNPDFTIDVSFPNNSGNGFSRDMVPSLDNCMDLPSLSGLTDETYHAVLVGDVNGNWTTGSGQSLRPNSDETLLSNLTDANQIVRIFPNPTKGDLINIIKPEEEKSITISIIDIFGKKVYSNITTNQIEQIDLSNYSSGIYYIIIENDTLLKSEKIMKN